MVSGETTLVSCKSCSTVVCVKCMESYINFSLNERTVPKCTNLPCNKYYFFSSFSRFAHLKEAYADCCLQELLRDYGDSGRKSYEIRSNIESLKRVRENFLTSRFPAGIARTASLIMPSKLRRLDKQIQEKIKKQTLSSKRVCFNLTCGGSLGENFICLTCSTKFCSQCEKVLDNKHVCNNDDIESIKTIKEFVHCPSCNLPILRSHGCDNMTCAGCGQFFNFRTGEAGGSGGHVKQVETKTKMLLSVVYSDILDQLSLKDLMLEVESLQPTSEPKITGIITLLTNYHSSNQTLTLQQKFKLARLFETYTEATQQHKIFNKAISELEALVNLRTINANHLHRVLESLRSNI